jgi:hypothetical protein
MNINTIQHHQQVMIEQRHVVMWTATLLTSLAIMIGGIIFGIHSLSMVSTVSGSEVENIKTDKLGPISLLVSFTGLISFTSFIMIVSLTMKNSLLLLKYLCVLNVIVWIPFIVLMILSTNVVTRVFGIFGWIPYLWSTMGTNKLLSTITNGNLGRSVITFRFVVTSLTWTFVLFLGAIVIGHVSGLIGWFRIYMNTMSDIPAFFAFELSLFLFALPISKKLLIMQVIRKNFGWYDNKS